jgi:hypothetical protein
MQKRFALSPEEWYSEDVAAEGLRFGVRTLCGFDSSFRVLGGAWLRPILPVDTGMDRRTTVLQKGMSRRRCLSWQRYM